MTINKIETVRTLLKYTGSDNEQADAVIRGAIAILEGALLEVGTVGMETEPKQKATQSMGNEKPKQKRKPFDTGKMKALLNGGWPVAKIADEMGCSTVTIYDHMKKEGIAVGKS